MKQTKKHGGVLITNDEGTIGLLVTQEELTKHREQIEIELSKLCESAIDDGEFHLAFLGPFGGNQ